MNIKKFVFVFLLTLLAGANQKVLGQSWTIRTNLAYDAMLIPSLGAEYALSDRHSISLMGTYNRFNSGDKKWKNWSVQPELRLWREAPFMGWFMGINVIGGGFNINNVQIGGLGEKHRQGYMMGTGLSVGYHKMLSTHWNLEFSLGADVLLTSYDRFNVGEYEGHFERGIVLPIGTGISLVYVIY